MAISAGGKLATDTPEVPAITDHRRLGPGSGRRHVPGGVLWGRPSPPVRRAWGGADLSQPFEEAQPEDVIEVSPARVPSLCGNLAVVPADVRGVRVHQW